MYENLNQLLEQVGPLAPVLYVLLYVATALIPVIPTPLVSALGGSFLGFTTAVLFGLVGLALGAFIALSIARMWGRPAVYRLLGEKTVTRWEYLLGIHSLWLWGVMFAVLNIDLIVVIAGLSRQSFWKLWLTAVLARFPWVILAAYFGEAFFTSKNAWLNILIVLGLLLLALRFLRPWLMRMTASRIEKESDLP